MPTDMSGPTIKREKTKETSMEYRATVVDLVPGVSDETRASDCSSVAVANTIEEAEVQAIEGSAVNCNRRVYVQENEAPFRTVKGPYVLKASCPAVRAEDD